MEIGSEFETNSNMTGQNEFFELNGCPKRFFLSGRTGLHFVGQEIRETVSEIMLPEYCCGSMISPFVANGIKVSFYNSFDLKNVHVRDQVQAILILDYFGFLSDETLHFVSRCTAAGKIVIVDATQSAFSYSKTYALADYVVVSYRKWLDCLCAVVYSKNGFRSCASEMKLASYTRTWRIAAKLKTDYLAGLSSDKKAFLDLYAQANKELDADYYGYVPDRKELEILRGAESSYLRKKRRENAAYLMDSVNNLSERFDVQLVFDVMKKEDCPLFVPILVNEDKRKAIRSLLIDNGVYCPVHWPIDQRYPNQICLYHKRELSLICDQRYGILDMEKQIEVLSQALVMSDH